MSLFNNFINQVMKIHKNEVFMYSMLSQIGSLSIFAIGISLEQSKVSDYPRVVCFIYTIIHLLLSLFFIPCLYKQGILKDVLKKQWWKYIIIAFCEFEGSFLFTMAYHYSSYILIQVLFI
ncbi:Solute carrier family 35 member F1 [Thelohanellus kitauei]|uniref:Solute carrier family 35 member F1 n=1 Tax=Thelohanellus kitauei TaxID=669202 RepID=A0A0C2NGB2_THEKT|nr:Solute carrier family 35 member F1 [Thelohanellus kitauei]